MGAAVYSDRVVIADALNPLTMSQTPSENSKQRNGQRGQAGPGVHVGG